MHDERPPRRRLTAAHPDHDLLDLYELTWEGDSPDDRPDCDGGDAHSDWERSIAPELVRRWNAFEAGGFVPLATEALLASVERRDFCIAACARYTHYEDYDMKTGETERSVEDEGEHLCDCGAVSIRAALAALGGDAGGEKVE